MIVALPDTCQNDLQVICRWIKHTIGVELSNKQIIDYCFKNTKVVNSKRLIFINSKISLWGMIKRGIQISISEEVAKKIEDIKRQLKGVRISSPFIVYAILHEQANICRELCRIKGIN